MAYVSGLGYRVTATARAHANGDVNTFTVSAGGLAIVNLIYGVVTVAAGAACLVTAGSDPTLGTMTTVAWSVAADVDTLDVGDPICLNYVAGTLTTVLTGVSGNYRFFAPAGTIFVRGSAVQGTSQWTLFYMPVIAGTTIVTI
jgi:hypothetical protein